MTLQPLSNPGAAGGDLVRWVSMLAPARQLAEVIADTEFVPKPMRNRPDVITAAIMYGDELGIGPMQSLAGIDVVEGRPRPSAELARALILRDGHSFVIHETTATRARVSGLRAGEDESQRLYLEWTIDDARNAGLVNKQNWRQYPRAMLLARATTDMAKGKFADVVKGLSDLAETTADLDTMAGWNPHPFEPPAEIAEPEPEPAQRRVIQRRPVERADPADNSPIRPEIPEPAQREPEPDEYRPRSPRRRPVEDVELPAERPAQPERYVPTRDRMTDAQRPMSDAQRRTIFAVIGDLIPEARRAERLALCAAIVGRPIESTNDLSKAEAYKCIDYLHRIRAGVAGWEYDEDSMTGRVWDLEQPMTEDPPEWRE
jgi:hypothetical protein